MKHRYHKRTKRISKVEAWFIIIAGVIIGTVFCFGSHYWKSPAISKEDTIYTEAIFSSYEEKRNRRNSEAEIKIFFQDRDPLFIDKTCCNQAVLDKMALLQSGDILRMYIHPNKSTLLDIQSGDNSIISFDNTIEKLSTESFGFCFLGIFMYLGAIFGCIKLIRKETY